MYYQQSESIYAQAQTNIAQPLLIGDSDSEESSIRIATHKAAGVRSDQNAARVGKPDRPDLKVSTTLSYGGPAPHRFKGEDLTADPTET